MKKLWSVVCALAFGLLAFGIPSEAQARVCRDGIDCFCDRATGRGPLGVADPAYDPEVVFCEDFERDDLNNGAPGTGGRRGWHELYGVGTTSCIYNPNPGSGTAYTIMAPGVENSCVLVVREPGCEVDGETDCAFDGRQALAHRFVPGRTQGVSGTARWSRKVRRFGVTYAVKYTPNFQIPRVANKHNEFGVGNAPLLGASTSNTGRNHPFGGSVFTAGGAGINRVYRGIYRMDGTVPGPSGGRIRYSPETADYEWGTDFSPGEWGCFQIHFDGWGTAHARHRVWFQSERVPRRLILDAELNMSSYQFGADSEGIDRFVWNNYYNNGYTGSTVAHRLEDNVVVTAGPEPVPCSSLGFGSESPESSSSTTPQPGIEGSSELASGPGAEPADPAAASTPEAPLTVSISGSPPVVSAAVPSGTGPYQFLMDCDSTGNWDVVVDSPEPRAEGTCQPGVSAVRVWVWDQGQNETYERTVTMDAASPTGLGPPGRPILLQ